MNYLVYEGNHYFGLGPILKPKYKLANTFSDTITNTVTNLETTFQR